MISSMRCLKIAIRFAIFSTAGLAISTAWAESGPLYLLSGTPTNGESLPVTLFSVDSGSAGPVKLVGDIAMGLSGVFADYEKRLLVVASPDVKAVDFTVIDIDTGATKEVMHAPNMPKHVVAGGMFLLDVPGRGVGVALALNKVTPPTTVEFASALTFVALGSPDPAVEIPFDNFRYIRFSGFPGGAVVMPPSEVALRGDPLGVLFGRPIGVGGIASRPPYLKQRDLNDSYLLIASDDARIIIQPSEPGVIDVFNKASNEWRRVPLPFSSSRIRTFGHWLAAIEERTPASSLKTKGLTTINRDQLGVLDESPGAAKRRSEQIGPDYRLEPGTTVDNLFEMSQIRNVVFPGELLVSNLDTGAQLRISTGSGDSEVLFANDDAVFYRVDDALYRRQIAGATLGGAVKLAEGPEIVQVHWAFLN